MIADLYLSTVDNAHDFEEGYTISPMNKQNIEFLKTDGDNITTMTVEVRKIVTTKVTDDFFD